MASTLSAELHTKRFQTLQAVVQSVVQTLSHHLVHSQRMLQHGQSLLTYKVHRAWPCRHARPPELPPRAGHAAANAPSVSMHTSYSRKSSPRALTQLTQQLCRPRHTPSAAQPSQPNGGNATALCQACERSRTSLPTPPGNRRARAPPLWMRS